MYTLYIDTHDKQIVIGLFKDGNLIGKIIKESSRNHSDYTMPLVKAILEENKITTQDLSEILVVNGPGSFTGVRIGVTIAKTLAYTLDIPIKTITSLEMLAVSSKISSKKVITIKDIKGVFYGIFDKDDNLVGELAYKSNDDFKVFIEAENIPIVNDFQIDLEAIYKRFQTKEPTIAHNVNPSYIKVIEVLKND